MLLLIMATPMCQQIFCLWDVTCQGIYLFVFAEIIICFFSPGHGGNNILHYAAKSANLETVRYCLGQGMQVNR